MNHGNYDDSTRYLLETITKQLDQGRRVIEIKKAEYHIFDLSCGERYVEVSNNDNGLRHVFIAIEDRSDIVFDWNGSLLIFHGIVIPFYVTGCTNILFKNVEIDWFEDHHVELEAGSMNGKERTFRVLNSARPEQVRDTLICNSDLAISPTRLIQHLMGIDRGRKEPSRDTEEIWLFDGYSAQIVDDKVTIISDQLRNLEPGTHFILENHFRPAPAIVLSNCRNTVLQNLVIRYALGMAVVAQLCDSVSLENVDVLPSESRSISTLADAFHFVQCRGIVRVDSCTCNSQMDDAINVHGLYAKVSPAKIDGAFILSMNHHQQWGTLFGFPGDDVRVFTKHGLEPVFDAKITGIKRMNQHRTVLYLDETPDLIPQDYIIENLSAYPEVHIYRNTFDKNRARNILVTSRKRTVIDQNHFRSSGSAIKIAGDNNTWYESGPVGEVFISNNVFEDCNYATQVWGKGVIEISPDLGSFPSNAEYHGSIDIRNNVFIKWNRAGIICNKTNKLVFINNTTNGNTPFEIFVDTQGQHEIEGKNIDLVEGASR